MNRNRIAVRAESRFLRLGLLVAAASMSSLFACSDEGSEVKDIRTSRLSVRDTTHKQTTEFAQEGSTAANVDEATLVDTFQLTLHPLLLERCSGCHSAAVAPYFASDNVVQAYKAITQGGKVDFSNPANSRLVQRLAIESHNCWNECKADAQSIREQVEKWIADSGLNAVGQSQTFALQTPELPLATIPRPYEAAPADPNDPNPPQDLVELVVEAEFLEIPPNWDVADQPAQGGNPARDYIIAVRGGNMYTEDEIKDLTGIPEFSFMFFVPEERNYHFYALGAGIANSDNEFFFRIDDDEDWSTGDFDATGVFKLDRFAQRELLPGPHVVTIRQRSANIRIDKFVMTTRAPNQGQVLSNTTDMTLEQGAMHPRFLTFDISSLTGVAGSQFIVSAEAYTATSYLITAPFVLIGSKAFRVQGIRPLINGNFAPQHTHWAGLDKSIKAPFGQLTSIGLPLNADKGPAEDKLSFAFDAFVEVDPATVSGAP